MTRKETTELLTEVLIRDRLTDRKYYAREVTLDYGTIHSKRVDVMQFIPKGVIHASDMEKGIFVCYEIKSCIADVYSGNGLGFYGEKNFIVITMETWKKLSVDYNDGKLSQYILENYPESSRHYGILVAVPSKIDIRNSSEVYAEFENPTEFEGEAKDWRLWTAIPCHEGGRNRSTVELLFCMLRSKHSYTNAEMLPQEEIPEKKKTGNVI